MIEFVIARRGAPCHLAVLLAIFCLFAGAQAQAQMSSPHVVGTDRGGLIAERVREIARLQARRQPIEIRGRLCYSTCTMFLGARNVCISPATSFGFHGPSSYGTPLPKRQFEHWSRVMAAYYSEPLRDWFMARARHTIHQPYRISGAELIRMGYRAC